MMTRPGLWGWGVGITSVALMTALQAQEQHATPSLPQATSQAAAPQDDTAVFTFTSDEQMSRFTQLWEQRKGLLTRMAVLQAYWNEEQALLAKVNQQLLSTYHLDPNKQYTLDAGRKVLIERETPPEQPPAPASP